MTTDSNRNVYAASQVFGQNLKADTFYVPSSNVAQGFGKILLTSYKCDGSMRWARLLECNGVAYVYGMQYDGGANLYVAGKMTGADKYFGSDTTVATPNLHNVLVKFDTLGAIKWIRFLGADNSQNQLLTGSNYGSLAIDGVGNIHHYVDMKSGVQISPAVISIRGTYDLRYSPTGILLSAMRLSLDSTARLSRPVMNKQSGTAYFLCGPNPNFPSNNHPNLIAAIAPSGAVLWKDTLSIGGLNSLYYDGIGHLYSGGGTGLSSFAIKGQTVTNTTYTNGGLGVIVKLDTLGNVKWIHKNESNFNVCTLGEIVSLSNGNLFSSGRLGGIAKSGSDSISVLQSEGQNPYFAMVDTAGNHVQFGQMRGNGFYDRAFSVTIDKQGSVYMGGQVEDSIKAPAAGVTPYKSNGGSSDFFLAKYGFDCNCTIAPTSSFTKTQNNATRTVTVTYTGTTTALDSLVWQWGDGQKLKVTSNYTAPVTHTYGGSGSSFSACAIAYSGCGTAQNCQSVQFPTAIYGVGQQESVSLVAIPNPARTVVALAYDYGDGAALRANRSLIIYDATGRVVHRAQVSEMKGSITVPVESWAAGTYMVRMEEGGKTLLAQRLTVTH